MKEILKSEVEEISVIEDKNVNLSLRTKESLKAKFKDVEGQTDNDKLIKLLELYNKFQATQDKFSIDDNLAVIDKAMNTIQSQIKAITSSVNQYETTLYENYIVGVSEELNTVREEIENEEMLNVKIFNSLKENEMLNEKLQKAEEEKTKIKTKLLELEEENKNCISLNNSLVSKENDYINKLIEKDAVINSKSIENNNLINAYEIKLNELEAKYKAEMDKLINKINVIEKDRAVIEKEKENLISQNTDLKADIEQIKKESKSDIKLLEKEHRNEIKALENEIKELEKQNAKLEAKTEMLEAKKTEKKTENKTKKQD